MANILIVEDEPRMRRLLEIALGEDGHTVQIAPDAETAIKALRAAEYGSSGARGSDSGSPRASASQSPASQGSDSVAASKISNKSNVASGPSASGTSGGSSDNSNSLAPFNLVLTDVKLPGMSGLDFLQEVKRTNSSLPVIIMTAYGSVETAVEAMKLGASDYVLKPFTMAEMKLVIAKELDVQAVRDENRSLKEALGHRYQFRNIIARSRKMQEVLALVERVATTNSTVLVGGESGVGKDLIARAIHQHSRRAQGPFIKINSTAIPDTLLESELFGYERGAFTGAVAAKPGKFELADKGTLFLDEIGDVPGPIQVKLLRVLQEREFERLGGTRTIKVDVRLVAATNRDLRAALEQGTFREDLITG